MSQDYRADGQPREISDDTAAAAKEEIIRPIVFMEMKFDSGTVRMNSTPINIEHNGNIFYGVGNAGKISSMAESADMNANGLTLEWSGIDTDNIATALDDEYQGRPLEVYVGLVGPDGIIMTDLVSLGPWSLDIMNLDIGETATISVSAESRMALWNRAHSRKYTDKEQKILYPGDKGLEFVADAASKEIYWGR